MADKEINLFRFLGIDKHEVVISQFIVSILRLDRRFLALFLKEIGCEGFIDINNAIVVAENAIKSGSENFGRADIWIGGRDNHKTRRIIIENKIYAGDQSLQLRRYRNYLDDGREGHLFYLTLEGKPASIGSSKQDAFIDMVCTDSRHGYQLISYHTQIRSWLLKVKNCVDDHLLNMMIDQFLDVIKTRTAVYTLLTEDKAIIDVPENLKEEFAIALEMHFWNKLVSLFHDKQLTISPRRKYSFDKIKKCHSNKMDKAYGLICEDVRLQVVRKLQPKKRQGNTYLILKKGKFDDVGRWIDEGAFLEIEECCLTDIKNRETSDERASSVFDVFMSFKNRFVV